MIFCLPLWWASSEQPAFTNICDDPLSSLSVLIQRCLIVCDAAPPCRASVSRLHTADATISMARTDNGPISCAWNTKRLTFDLPPTVQAQGGQPDPVPRIRARVAAIPAQVEALYEVVVWYWIVLHACALVLLVECPCATRDGQVPRRREECGQDWRPRGQLVCVVRDDEYARPNIRMILQRRRRIFQGCRIEGLNVQMLLR